MVERTPFSTPPPSTTTTPSRGPQRRPRAISDTSSMSYVAVQQPASSHNLGRGHPHQHPHHPHHSQHSMVDMAPRSSAWMHEPYAPRYFPSPPDHSHPHHHQQQQQQQPTPPQSSHQGHGIRLPPASSLVSPPHHSGSPHAHHLPPPHHSGSPHAHHLPPPPPPPTSNSSRDTPFALKTHYQYTDPYGTPSPVGSAPSPQLLAGPRPIAPTSDAYSPVPRRQVADARQLSPTHSSSSSSAEEEGRLRQLQQQQQLAKAAIQQHERGHSKEAPVGGLALNTRQLPPPPAHTLSSPASARWSPIRHEGKVKIADLLLSDTVTDSKQPQIPTGMSTPLSAAAVAVPRANSRPASAKSHRPAIRSPAAILQPGKGAYSIRVRQQPVAARSCGFGERDRRVIDPPPIVQLSINDPSLSPEEVSRMIRHPFSVVHCSIYDQTGNQDNSAMPEDYRQQRRLMGTLVASPFVGLDENGEEGCFFCFPDLSCRTPGAFRLKFSLVVLNPAEMMPGNMSPIRAYAMSDVFTVYNAKDFPGMQASTPLTKRLKEQGCLISIKKGNEKVARGREESEEDDEDEGNGRRKRARKN